MTADGCVLQLNVGFGRESPPAGHGLEQFRKRNLAPKRHVEIGIAAACPLKSRETNRNFPGGALHPGRSTLRICQEGAAYSYINSPFAESAVLSSRAAAQGEGHER
ncbi:MAG: hypothetical protein KDG52_10880 [Rhodocyclaceae bacterium]|nr:hypothetical protein [Rhodocyclaceae bacterium]